MILEPEEALETTELIASEVSEAGFMNLHIVNHIIELFVSSSKTYGIRSYTFVTRRGLCGT